VSRQIRIEQLLNENISAPFTWYVPKRPRKEMENGHFAFIQSSVLFSAPYF